METTPTSQEKRPRKGFLTPSFVLLFVAHFIVVSTYFLLMTTMARHAIEAFACSDAMAGLTASIFLVGAALSRIVAGRFADAVGLKRSSIAALVVMLASYLLYPAAETALPFMLALRFVHGMSFGIANTTMPAIAAEIIPVEVMGEGTGWFMLSNSLGVGIGPLFGLLVSGSFDYTVLYWACSALAVVALAATLPLAAGRPPAGGTRAAVRELPKFRLSLVLDPATRRFSFFMFLVAFAYSSVNSFIGVFAAEVDLAAWAPFVFLAYSVALVLIRPPVGRLQDRRGENAVLYRAIAAMGVGTLVCALVAFFPLPPLLLSVGVFSALGFGTCMSAGLAVIGRDSGGEKAAPGIATFYLLCDFGCGIGPFLLGFVTGPLGYPAMYICCSIVAAIGVAYYHFSHGRSHRGGAPADE